MQSRTAVLTRARETSQKKHKLNYRDMPADVSVKETSKGSGVASLNDVNFSETYLFLFVR